MLTFYEEAERGENENEASYLERMQPLRKLARRDMTKENPLRMFVTGPAGAGKCKFEKRPDGGANLKFPCSNILFDFVSVSQDVG